MGNGWLCQLPNSLAEQIDALIIGQVLASKTVVGNGVSISRSLLDREPLQARKLSTQGLQPVCKSLSVLEADLGS